MPQYDNLKDYFNSEHLELIRVTISKYYLSKYNQVVDIKNVRIQKLRCLYEKYLPDSGSNLKVEAGVSIQFVNQIENKDSELHFLVMISGDLRWKLSNIKVNVIKEICANEMPEETIYNQFLLPTINADDIERLFKEFYHLIHNDKDIKSVLPLTFIAFFKDLQLPIYFAELDDTCLGRLNLAESDIDIYMLDETNNDLVLYSNKAIYGTIILNRKKYYDEVEGELFITLSHELVHWIFHQKFFKILVLLGNDDESLNCKAQLPIFNNNLNDSQKALCIAEWQANELSWRIVMPEVGVKYYLERFSKIDSIKNYPKWLSYEAIVFGIASVYNVSPYVAKKRLRQLGYDYVDGTCLEIDGKTYPTFTFHQGTLKENETFVIDRSNYERLLRENDEFAELIEKRYFVYTGYVVCYNHPKYIKHKISHGVIEYALSDYAREHADECCYKFKYKYTTNHNSFTEYPICQYLCKLDDLRLTIITDGDTNAKQYKAIMDKIREDKKKAEKTKARMLLDDITTFSDAFKYHKKKIKGLTYPKIENAYGIPVDTLKAYAAPKDSKKFRNPSLENVMLLCHAFHLPHDTAIDFLTKAKTPLEKNNALHMLYDDLLRITDEPIDFWNKYLTENGRESLKAVLEETDEK